MAREATSASEEATSSSEATSEDAGADPSWDPEASSSSEESEIDVASSTSSDSTSASEQDTRPTRHKAGIRSVGQGVNERWPRQQQSAAFE